MVPPKSCSMSWGRLAMSNWRACDPTHEQRELLDVLRRDLPLDFGIVKVDGRNILVDFDGLGFSAQFQLDLNPGNLVGKHMDAPLHEFLEACDGSPQLIFARLKIRETEQAIRTRSHTNRHSCPHWRQSQFDSWNRQSRWVGDAARKRGIKTLGPNVQGEQKQHNSGQTTR